MSDGWDACLLWRLDSQSCTIAAEETFLMVQIQALDMKSRQNDALLQHPSQSFLQGHVELTLLAAILA